MRRLNRGKQFMIASLLDIQYNIGISYLVLGSWHLLMLIYLSRYQHLVFGTWY